MGTPTRDIAKRTILNFFPDLFYAISSFRNYRYCKRRYELFQNDFYRNVYQGKSIEVLSGPFQGLKYLNKTVWGPITPKWIGSYESELHDIINEIIKGDYKQIIDIGAAEGYYAVGLARACTSAKVVAFDIDLIARKRQKLLAKLNNVSNISFRKFCTHKELSNMLTTSDRSLLVCDIEGNELELLNPTKIHGIDLADVLVEIHPCGSLASKEVENLLRERFTSTHQITQKKVMACHVDDQLKNTKGLSHLEHQYLLKAMQEDRRADQTWLWMKSNRHLVN